MHNKVARAQLEEGLNRLDLVARALGNLAFGAQYPLEFVVIDNQQIPGGHAETPGNAP